MLTGAWGLAVKVYVTIFYVAMLQAFWSDTRGPLNGSTQHVFKRLEKQFTWAMKNSWLFRVYRGFYYPVSYVGITLQ